MDTTEFCDELELQIKRIQLIDEFAQIDEITRHERVERYLEIDRQRIIGLHHFAHASTECINLYRDGHYIATVMTTQAVNEGIIKFVSKRNNIQFENMNLSDLLQTLKSDGIFSQKCFEASDQLRKSYRNDVHHMNPIVAQINFSELAQKNIQNLTVVEREIWATNFNDGKIVPIQPKYWDINLDGTVPIYLRCGI